MYISSATGGLLNDVVGGMVDIDGPEVADITVSEYTGVDVCGVTPSANVLGAGAGVDAGPAPSWSIEPGCGAGATGANCC